MYRYFACMCICATHIHEVSTKARRIHQIPLEWQFWAAIWGLRIKSGSLEDQPVLITTASSLQAPTWFNKQLEGWSNSTVHKLLHKHEGPSFNPQHQHKAGVATHAWNSSTGKVGASRSSLIIKSQISKKNTISQNKVKSSTCMHTHAHTLTKHGKTNKLSILR